MYNIFLHRYSVINMKYHGCTLYIYSRLVIMLFFFTEEVLRERFNNRSAGVKLLAVVPVILAHQEQSLPG